MANPKSKMLSTVDAAHILGISDAYLRRLIMKGEIKGEKIGGNWVIYERSLSHFKRQRFKKSDMEIQDGSSK